MVRIGRIGAEGDGIAELADGTQLFLRDALPGETVRARPAARRGEGFAAETAAVVTSSADRQPALCRHFPACGGCTLQHWRDEPYLAWKAGLLEAALRRAGYTPSLAPIVRTPPRTRRRMDLAVRREGRGVRLGLHAPRGAAVVDLLDCHVLHPALTALLPPLRATLAGLAGVRREASVLANLLDTGPDLLLRGDGGLTTADRARLAGFARAHGVPRIAWAQGSGVPEIACQDGPAHTVFGTVRVAPPPGAFLQASAPGEAALVAAVRAGVPAGLTRRARIADLYAGCGTFAFALAGHARVAAFEGDAGAAAALRAAANAAGLAGRVETHTRDLARQPLSAAELSGFAAVVLDPPHAGASAQMPTLAASGVARIVYVSCNPAALARDATLLREAGYGLLAATPIDQFLWSARLESVAVFIR